MLDPITWNHHANTKSSTLDGAEEDARSDTRLKHVLLKDWNSKETSQES